MRIIVSPQKDERQERVCRLAITQCALCAENPRWCDGGAGGP